MRRANFPEEKRKYFCSSSYPYRDSKQTKQEITKATDITIVFRLQEMEHKKQEKLSLAKQQALIEEEQRRRKDEQAKMHQKSRSCTKSQNC